MNASECEFVPHFELRARAPTLPTPSMGPYLENVLLPGAGHAREPLNLARDIVVPRIRVRARENYSPLERSPPPFTDRRYDVGQGARR